MAARHFKITGDVQGVGFRYAMTSEARRLRLAGWVRNRADGSVEAVAVGDAAALGQLEQWAQHGPPAAIVQHVESRAASDVEAAGASEPFKTSA
ncbi:MAG: acylphosphatase [Burkholderiaceae bacterium]